MENTEKAVHVKIVAHVAKKMNRLLFVYDKLMTYEEQQKAGIELKFLAFGMMNASMKKMTVIKKYSNKKRKERIFAVPHNGLRKIFGGIFLIEDRQENFLNLYAYYNSSEMLIGYPLSTDLFYVVESIVKQIKFTSLTQLETCRYEIGKEVMCSCFVGNKGNKRIKHNSSHGCFSVPSIDVKSFTQLIKEMKENGMERSKKCKQ